MRDYAPKPTPGHPSNQKVAGQLTGAVIPRGIRSSPSPHDLLFDRGAMTTDSV